MPCLTDNDGNQQVAARDVECFKTGSAATLLHCFVTLRRWIVGLRLTIKVDSCDLESLSKWRDWMQETADSATDDPDGADIIEFDQAIRSLIRRSHLLPDAIRAKESK